MLRQAPSLDHVSSRRHRAPKPAADELLSPQRYDTTGTCVKAVAAIALRSIRAAGAATSSRLFCLEERVSSIDRSR
jgi:hypothetical protein